jgi:hypothetical protein
MLDSEKLVTGCRQALSVPEPVLAVRDVDARAVSDSEPLPDVYGGDLASTPLREWDFGGHNKHLFDLAAVRRFIATVGERDAALGRELSPEEVRQACFEFYGKVADR